jgi:hypothetical protein
MITLCKIDGKSFDVLVTAIAESFEVVEGANSGTAIYRQREIRDILGVKIGHSITFAPDNDPEVFDELVNYLFGTVRESVILEAVHNQKTISYEAAYNTGARKVSHIDEDNDVVYWDELTIDFRPIETQINKE